MRGLVMSAGRPLLASLLALAAGIALAWLAVPRLAAGLIAGPFDATVEALGQNADAVPVQGLRLAASSRRNALAWQDDPHLAASLGAVEFALAQRPLSSAGNAQTVDAARLRRSIAFLARGLAGAPAEPFAWIQLVHAARSAGAPAGTVDPALRLAVAAAPTHPRLVRPRLALALANWTHLSAATKAAFARQAELAMLWWPQEMVALVRQSRGLAPMREALSGSPTLRAEFDLAWTFGR